MTTSCNSFPGYTWYHDSKINKIRNMYRGVDLGTGGYVYAEPGMYYNVALLDVNSLHPHSIIELNMFGEYTKNFKDLVDARIAIKHGDFDKAKTMLDGKLAPYLEDERIAKDLAYALKIGINSCYGLTASKKYVTPFTDPRNKNNIVALRGALFMKTLQDEVQARGYTVAHIKTDSIKIPNYDNDILDFCFEFAKKYGYTFEHEATYERMCLINNAVYIAKYLDGDWTATGTQFIQPYVFKTLFSQELVSFEDKCETKSVQKGAIYLDMNERLSEDEHNYIFVGKVGSFCPIEPGFGGGKLLCLNDGKYTSVTGAKDYRWMESETVAALGLEDHLDQSYYDHLIDDAIANISKYGNFEKFISKPNIMELPPWEGEDMIHRKENQHEQN